ncbi:DinB/UmuC family translesion DNA polymerase [Parageobacillus thermoglucosidasius]|uniref:DinB/UmuC family translesion DNA polymerase n=1 Tax=Parageobacillus thermoglucosidasius TaxID=1426 RepID=UPI001E63EA2E|nr:hypothetical protein [Parageobacillus thermoglucosidasius]MED4905404.1 hypothetical protein [Parageobacillus thermoglucosidasius]MED4913803.1 hypothetical protein [Parageobacillus thermoglucosidasius]MED4946128.1 hypothetical protein [Parageobacillus thermoglucosidasius]MED4984013.1 hypothetical protein [Parageobacillus thermoglucosidasius]
MRRWRNGSVKERTVSFSVRYSIMKENYQSVTFDTGTNLTMDIYHVCKRILHKFYDGQNMRVIVIYVSLENLMDEESLQLSLFEDRTKERTLVKTMDAIRNRSELPFVRSQLHIRKRRQYPKQ